jgi:hypothetical protein
MARPDRNTKMLYILVGTMIGAILARTVILLKRRATQAADREKMTARLEQLAL